MAADRFLDTEGLRHLWEKIKAWIPFLSRKTQSIPFGQVDSTSTATVFTATVDGIDELRDGVCCYLRNGVVTSASGFTININGLGAKPVYNTMASATALTTHFNINYTMLFIYNSTRVSGGCWDMYVGYDTNTTYNLNTNYTTVGHINVGAYPLHYYSLCAFDINDKLTPFVTTATTSTGKTLVPSVFPIGAKIYSSNYTQAANTSLNDAQYLLTTAANQDLRYSSVNHNLAIFPNKTFNRIFMPVIVDVANNTFTLTTQTTNGYTNNFTNERSLKADNFYIEIGFNGKWDYSYFYTLIQNNPLYYYDGTRLIEYSIFKSSIIDVPEYTIEKLASAETGYSSSYVLKKDNVQVGATINIPKDMVVSSGEVKTVTTANVPYQGAQVGDKYIDLTIANTAQNHIYIPVKDLVDVYVAGNGIQISDNNYISVKVNQNQSNGLGVGYDGISMYVVTPSINGVGGTNGSMLATDKEKLDGIEAGAEENVIETVKVSGTALQVTDKAVNIETETAYDPTTNKIATMSDVESATSGMAIDTNVVHKTGNETIAGVKTFTDSVKLNTNATLDFASSESIHYPAHEITVKNGMYDEDNDVGITGVLEFNDVDKDGDVRLRGIELPVLDNDAVNKIYVDNSTALYLNGYVSSHSLVPGELFAFGISDNGGGASMYITPFTYGIPNVPSNHLLPVTDYKFPIGCKIYYNPNYLTVPNTEVVAGKFYASYKYVFAAGNAIQSSSLNLQMSTNSAVFLRVSIVGNYWKVYSKEDSIVEILVTTNDLVSGNYYIYLGRTTGGDKTEGVHYFQLEDNNPLYYYDGTNLVDWATRLKTIIEWQSTQDMSLKADKVEEATNGNLAGLDYTGNLTDSGLAADEVATLGTNQLTNYYKKTELYSKSETDALVRAASDFEYEEVSTLPTASANTKGKFYLYNGHRYVTTEKAGGSFSWVDLGSYDIDLSGYVTNSTFEEAMRVRPEHQEVTEAQLRSMLDNETWEENVIYYTVEEE